MRMPEAELVGIADIDAGRAAAAAAAAGEVASFTSAEEMLDSIEADVLDIVTPPETHHALVTLAAERGLSAICQKPVAPTYAEAAAVVSLAEAAGTLLAIHENFRFQPWHCELKGLIDAGRLGRPHGISFRLRPGDGQGPSPYPLRQPYFLEMPRFLIHETAIHFIDVFRYLFGEVAAVFADLRQLNPAIAGEDAGHVLFRFKNDARGLFDGNRLNDHVAENTTLTMGEMWLEGEGGVLRLDGDGNIWWKPHQGVEIAHSFSWSDVGFGGDCVYATQAHVAAHLRHGVPLVNSGRDYLRNMAIEEAIYRSAREGCWIDV